MKRILFIAVMVLAVVFAGGKTNAFEINDVVINGEQVILQTTYGGDIYLTRGQNAVPQIIELRLDNRSASIRDLLSEKPKFSVKFLKGGDLRVFNLFLMKTSDKVGACSSPIVRRDLCPVYVLF